MSPGSRVVINQSGYLINKFIYGSLPLEEDLVEAAEAAGVGHVPGVRDGHPGHGFSISFYRYYREFSLEGQYSSNRESLVVDHIHIGRLAGFSLVYVIFTK